MGLSISKYFTASSVAAPGSSAGPSPSLNLTPEVRSEVADQVSPLPPRPTQAPPAAGAMPPRQMPPRKLTARGSSAAVTGGQPLTNLAAKPQPAKVAAPVPTSIADSLVNFADSAAKVGGKIAEMAPDGIRENAGDVATIVASEGLFRIAKEGSQLHQAAQTIGLGAVAKIGKRNSDANKADTKEENKKS